MKKTFFKLLSYLKPHKKRFIIGQIAMLIGTSAALVFPMLLGQLLDSSFDTVSTALWTTIGLMAGVAVVESIANYIKDINLQYISQQLIFSLRTGLYKKLQQLSIDFYRRRNSGELLSSMSNDINLFQGALSVGITYIMQMAISLVVVTTLLFTIDPLLTLVLIVCIPVILLITRATGKKAKNISKKTQEKLSQITSILSQSISGISIIKAFGLEKHARNMFKSENSSWLSHTLKHVKIRAKNGMFVGMINMMQLILILGIGAYRVSTGNITVGSLVSFVMYSQMLSGPLRFMADLYVEVNKSLAAADRVFDIMDETNDIIAPENPVEMPEITGKLEFEDVSFSYPDGTKVFNNISFEVKPGQTAAFVGGSGAGKTTMFNLIPRFYDTESGSIKIDGIDITNANPKQLREKISIVPQQSYLFEMSIKDNIACGCLDATDEEIINAAKAANAHDFIMETPNGYDTIAGEGGVRLSGGQRQRIAIARAFLKNSKILLLDEATSSLDNMSEKIVQGAIEKLMKGRTTLIIAHRLSTIVNSDVIFVLHEGQIVDKGTHNELLENSDVYKGLYYSQAVIGESA